MKLVRLAAAGRRLLTLCLLAVVLWLGAIGGASASIRDDRFDGNIYALYAGNGSLVPPQVTLTQALQAKRPAMVVFYLDDSRDCKQFAGVVSGIQAPYGRLVDIIPVNADTVNPGQRYGKDQAEYYYKGTVPQVVLFDQQGKVQLDEAGQVSFEALESRLRRMLALEPRERLEAVQRREVNEFNSELVP